MFDAQLFADVNGLASATPWLHLTLLVYASYGIALFAALLLAGWWVARGRASPTAMAKALWAPAGMLIALGINQLIVDAVHEPRPYATLPGILVLAPRTLDPSFPSDHAVVAGAVTAGLFLADRRLGWTSAVAAVVMAFARVYVGAHYPHDVAAGLVVGAALSLLGYLALRHLLERLVALAARTPLWPLVTSAPPDARSGRGPSSHFQAR
ncbi:MAG: phosphatase PAP2 family protein [Pseudonocardia sp.]|nr:phosphatase PAP2 family protein [Pseudonocardia sp.]